MKNLACTGHLGNHTKKNEDSDGKFNNVVALLCYVVTISNHIEHVKHADNPKQKEVLNYYREIKKTCMSLCVVIDLQFLL
jgi:hypothetical protein